MIPQKVSQEYSNLAHQYQHITNAARLSAFAFIASGVVATAFSRPQYHLEDCVIGVSLLSVIAGFDVIRNRRMGNNYQQQMKRLEVELR